MKKNNLKPQKTFITSIIFAVFLLLSCNLLSQTNPSDQSAVPTITEVPTPAPDVYSMDITLRVLEGNDMKEKFSFTYKVDMTSPTDGSSLIIGDSSGEFLGKYSYNRGISCVGSSTVGGEFTFTMTAQRVQKILTELDPEVTDVITSAATNSPAIISDGQISMFTFSFTDPDFVYTNEPEGMCLPDAMTVQTDLNAKVLPMIWYVMHADAEMVRSIPADVVDFCFDPIHISGSNDPSNPGNLGKLIYYEICYNLSKK